jgi:hypothetical protein
VTRGRRVVDQTGNVYGRLTVVACRQRALTCLCTAAAALCYAFLSAARIGEDLNPQTVA